MTKPIILTGLRANNDLTLGNYFGGILPMIDMARTRSEDFQINMFIPDLHSFTTPIDHSGLYDQILHNAHLFVAAGLPLDNPSINLYRQSYISAHSELTWILDCFTSFGEMSRMTQFKDKAGSLPHYVRMNEIAEPHGQIRQKILVASENMNHHGTLSTSLDDPAKAMEHLMKAHEYQTEIIQLVSEIIEINTGIISEQNKITEKEGKVRVGMFNYPILMAADILLYGAKYVPVGDDQTQHLEFTRDIAERMNTRFGELFVVPEPVKKQHEFFGKDQGLRIMDLVDPTKKMSKSDELGKGVIFLSDDPDLAAKKIMSATTDDKANIRFDRKEQPGISNLLEILSLLRGATIQETARQFEGESRYGDFKKVVAEELKEFLTDFQTKLANVDHAAVMTKLEASEAAMNVQAKATLHSVQQAVGLRPKA